jgi:hypothetical protein
MHPIPESGDEFRIEFVPIQAPDDYGRPANDHIEIQHPEWWVRETLERLGDKVVEWNGRSNLIGHDDLTFGLLLKFQQWLIMGASSAVALKLSRGMYDLFKLWVDARNGRKLKIRVGDIEVEATQMSQQDVFRIVELLEQRAEGREIRAALLKNSRP